VTLFWKVVEVIALVVEDKKLPPMSKLSFLFYSHMGYIPYCFNSSAKRIDGR
jgi:hypothetical protein